MIRHTVLIACDGADAAAVDGVIAELRALPALIPEIASYTLGPDLGLDGSTAHIAITADFATVDDYRTYSAHPEHVRVINDHIKPIATAVNRAQFDY